MYPYLWAQEYGSLAGTMLEGGHVGGAESRPAKVERNSAGWPPQYECF